MEFRDDTFYINEVLGGKINSYSYLIERHKDRVFNLAFRICTNREEAEEIAQDAFLKAFRSLKHFKKKSSFSTWLYRIVYNTAISVVRSKRKGMLSIEDFPVNTLDFIGYTTNEDEAENEYRNSLVNFALQRISVEDRGLVSLYYYYELDCEEISKITGVSRTNIKVRLHRARKKIAEVIRKAEKENISYYEKHGSK